MIPISLSLEGLYSYQEKQTIDFTKLTGAQLFGIFGATGSGKSSILEAITFALYGQSERLNAKDKRGYNMMNLRSDRLQIEFEFEVKDQRYRFNAQGRRSSKDFEQVRTIERKAFKVEGKHLEPLEQANAESILGLSYDNFRRTIIIPQGKFMEFLQLSETDRTRMLKEIFNLQRFELSNKVKSLNYKNNLELEQKKTLLTELNSVTETALAERQAELTSQEAELTKAKTELAKLEKAFAKLESVKSLFEKIELQQQKVHELEAQKEGFANRENALKEYEYALVEFKPLLDRREERSTQLSQAQQELNTQKAALIAAENELASGEKLFAGIEKQFQEREQFLQEAEEFEAIIEINKKAAIVQAHQSRIDKGRAEIEKKKQAAEASRNSILNKRQEIKTLKGNMPDVVDVIAVKGWFADYQQINGRLQNAKQLLEREKKQLDELQGQKLSVLKETQLDPRQTNLQIPALLELLEENKHQARLKIGNTEKEITDLAVKEQLKNLSEALHDGEACPLCGSVHHADKPDFDNLTHHLNKARTQLVEQQAAQQKLAQQIASLQAMAPQFAQIDSRRKEAEALVLAAEGDRSKQEAGFIWSQFNREDDESLQLHLDQIQHNQQVLAELERDIQSAESSLMEHEKDLQKYQSVIEKLQAEREAAAIEFQGQAKALKRVSYESYQTWEEARLRRIADDKRASHRQIEETYRTQNDRIQRARENAAKLKGRIQELSKQESALTKGLAALNQELEQKISASQFANLQALREILNHNWHVEAVKNEIRSYRQKLHTESEKLGDMKAEAEGKSFVMADFETQEAGVLAQQKIVADWQIAIGSLQNDLARLEKDWQRKQLLQREFDQLDLRRENLRVLRNLFYSSGFVNYVSTIYLENLCRAANERFLRLTRGSLRLEKSPNNNTFDVIDQLNGGRRRSVKTLSGGQTFQASLCLALALADQVQQQAEAKQNFFFLDEGFGSQDKNSLSIIFETLKSLRKENRIVGVISHVEELQQEIGAYLQIHNDPEKGSQIQPSWN
ncbi:MAG: SMC family ATPase [Bacteroidota bacterium]